jgi:putative ABC transport system ATP-binding protein
MAAPGFEYMIWNSNLATACHAEYPKMHVVRVEGIYKDYLLGDQVVQALSNITLQIEQGVFLAISGPSGSGKTTLLNIIGCIDQPTKGRVFINDQDVTGWSNDKMADLRAHTIGFIFQTFNLLPVLSAAENVEYPLLYRKDVSREERQRRVKYFLDMVGLGGKGDHRPNQLSGGQRQRVAIARALAVQPAIVLADEPTANLDRATGSEILELMQNINKHLGTTFIFSTHDQRVIDLSNRLVRIEDGVMRELGVRRGNAWAMVPVASARKVSTPEIKDSPRASFGATESPGKET